MFKSYCYSRKVQSDTSDSYRIEMIWLNKIVMYKGKMLFSYRNWINSDILFVGDLMDGKSFLPVDELGKKIFVKNGRWYLQYAILEERFNHLGIC